MTMMCYETSQMFSYARRGQLKWLKRFHDEGGNILCKNHAGASLMHIAAEHGRLDCVIYLFEHGVDINGIDDQQWTPLHVASMNGHLACVQWLVQHGADNTLKDRNNKTAFDFASSEAVIEFLKGVYENRSLEVMIEGVSESYPFVF